MSINLFRYPDPSRRLMIWNLDTAREFMKQCKNGYYVKIDSARYLDITPSLVSVMKKIDSWTAYEEHSYKGVEAYRILFKYRKYINAKFSD